MICRVEDDSYCSARGYTPSIDDVPIMPVIDGKKLKTFEDLVEVALQKQPAFSDPVVLNRPKQPFLRKGSGLARFASPQKSPKKSIPTRSCSRNLFNVETKSITKQVDRVIRKPPRLCSSTVNASPETVVVKKLTSKIAAQKINPPRTTIRETFRRSSCPKTPEKLSNLPKVLPRKSFASEIVSQYSPNFQSIARNKPVKGKDIVCREPSKIESAKSSPKINKNYNNNDNKSENNSDGQSEDRIKVLQRLLQNIRLKQEELILGLENNKHVSDEDESDLDLQSDCESIGDSTVIKLQRKDSIDDESENCLNDQSDDDKNLFKIPKLNSTIQLKKKIEFLEDKLKDLNFKCKKDSEKLSNKNNLKEKKSPTMFNEMNDVKKQLDILTDKLDIIQTSLMKRNSSPVKNKPFSSQNYTKISNPYQQPKIDKKITLQDGNEIIKTADDKIIYSYKNGVRQTAFPDGSRLIQFPSGQKEKISSDGTKTVYYIDGTQRTIHADGVDEMITSDGTKIKITKDGTETVELPNGEKEIRTEKFKKREYLDGTVKIIYSDGKIETKFPNGRVRIKTRPGKSPRATTLSQPKAVA